MPDYSEYDKALKLGQRSYRIAKMNGENPYLPALDSFLSRNDIQREEDLGVIDIPLELIVGTKTVGRQTSFARNFLPILAKRSEFAQKWVNVLEYQMDTGVCDPIFVYEYMNRYYVEEGNKRVSILKYLNAYSIEGRVTRLIPKKTNDPQIRIYYEYMDFYRRTRINIIQFSGSGSYKSLTEAVGMKMDEVWTDEKREEFISCWNNFSNALEAELPVSQRKSVTDGDAFLMYLSIYPYSDLIGKEPAQIRQEISKIRKEILIMNSRPEDSLILDPSAEGESGFLSSFFGRTEKLPVQVAFIHDRFPSESGWVYGHELGRAYIDQKFGGKITTTSYYCLAEGAAEPEEKKDRQIVVRGNTENAVERAIEDGNTILFTTSGTMLDASLKAAVSHPQIRILNCSINRPYSSMRTYFGRMYEAKFLEGMVAGAMAEDNRIAFLADYPIYGTMANINAFALGAQMVNPRAAIDLYWYASKNCDLEKITAEHRISVISNVDMMRPGNQNRRYGLYLTQDGAFRTNLALPIWNWGAFYEKIIRDILSGCWNSSLSKEHPALNYWWGIRSGIIDLIMSRSLPDNLKRLVTLMRQEICDEAFHPFSGIMRDQNGNVRIEEGRTLTPEEIITMDWLLRGVEGEVPSDDQMTDLARKIISVQGVKADTDLS